MAQCIYCQSRSGFISRVCSDCRKLISAVKKLEENFGYRMLLDTLIDTGIDPNKIEKFLDADPNGTGSLSQRVTARMTNQLMTELGQPTQMTGKDVKEIEAKVARGESYLDQPEVTSHPKTENRQDKKS